MRLVVTVFRVVPAGSAVDVVVVVVVVLGVAWDYGWAWVARGHG